MKKNKWMWIEIAAIVMCAVAIILYVNFREQSAPQKGSEDVTESTSDMTTTTEETKETSETEETSETIETWETEETSEAEETSETEILATEPVTTDTVTATLSETEVPTTEFVTTAPPETEASTTEPVTTAPPETDPPATECSHSYTTTTVEATCAKKGSKTHTCAKCGYSYSETIQATGNHTAGQWTVTKSATCTETGAKAKSCTVCGKALQTSEIEALGHSWDEGVVTTAPTCAAEGVKTFTCGTCGHTDTEAITATGEHQWTVTKAVVEDPYSDEFEEDGEQVCDLCHTVQVIRGWDWINKVYGAGNYNEYLGFYEAWDEETRTYPDAWIELVEHRMLYYFNKWRVEEGVSPTTWLPRQREYARYRAMQLDTNFAHDIEDEEIAANALKYGNYYPESPEQRLDPETLTPYYTGNTVPAYYYATGGEAILKSGFEGTVDESAYHMAYVLHQSKGHWNGIGSEGYANMSVGIFDGSSATYVCVIMNTAERGPLYEQILGP